MPTTILVVDDKSDLRQLMEQYLTKQGYRVVMAGNGPDALYTARHEKPDLILLDIMMPEMDGLEFIRVFRRERDTPIILVTALQAETHKVVGLELGADDYITKPFGMRELLARVRAVLRRAERATHPGDTLRAGPITLNRSTYTVTIDDQSIDTLTPTEFALLETFMRTPGRVFTRGELLERLQGSTFEGAERTVDVHVRNLRGKIEPDPSHPCYIETVFGVGYRLAREKGEE